MTIRIGVGLNTNTFVKLSSRELQYRFGTASKALQETMPHSEKPFQVLTAESEIRSIHGVAYTRLWNDELLNVVAEAAPGFVAPQQAMNGATGLYCGEQDMFAFLIDPTGWVDINGQAFAPGFFIWNSEVGRRTVGVQSFWFQKVCQNHIVWDAVEVCESSRRHTARVRDLSNWWQAEFHHEKTRNLAGCANHESHAPTKMLQLTNSLRGLNFARQGSRVIKYLMT